MKARGSFSIADVFARPGGMKKGPKTTQQEVRIKGREVSLSSSYAPDVHSKVLLKSSDNQNH